jgi:hypothetical protein
MAKRLKEYVVWIAKDRQEVKGKTGSPSGLTPSFIISCRKTRKLAFGMNGIRVMSQYFKHY